MEVLHILTGKDLLQLASNSKIIFDVYNGDWSCKLDIRGAQPYLYCMRLGDYYGEVFNSYPIHNSTKLDLYITLVELEQENEKYKTCSRCIHESESGDISGSTCYLCKRNPVDHRIDWFEERC